MVTTCDMSGSFSRNTVAVITLVMLAIERWSLRVLFPEHLMRLGIVDDRGRRADVRNQVAARVHLVARQDRVGHLARRRHRPGAVRATVLREADRSAEYAVVRTTGFVVFATVVCVAADFDLSVAFFFVVSVAACAARTGVTETLSRLSSTHEANQTARFGFTNLCTERAPNKGLPRVDAT